jgi:chromosome segregation ATPase
MIDYIQHILEIEEIKKEHDKLMIAKVTKYENKINTLAVEIVRLKSLLYGNLADLKNAEETRLKLVKKIKELEKIIEDNRVGQGGWVS